MATIAVRIIFVATIAVRIIFVATIVTKISSSTTIATTIICRHIVGADQDIIAIYIIIIYIAIRHIIGTHNGITIVITDHIAVINSSHDVATVATAVAAATTTTATTINIIIIARDHGSIAGIGPHAAHSSGRVPSTHHRLLLHLHLHLKRVC